jgi:hypothetical protein
MEASGRFKREISAWKKKGGMIDSSAAFSRDKTHRYRLPRGASAA